MGWERGEADGKLFCLELTRKSYNFFSKKNQKSASFF